MPTYSSPAMQQLGVVQSPLAKKITAPKETGDSTVDFMKAQQHLALVETCDMLQAHAHLRQSVRDYSHGLLAAGRKQLDQVKHDHFDVAPTILNKIDEDWLAGFVVAHTALTIEDLSKLRAADSKFVRKFSYVFSPACPVFVCPSSVCPSQCSRRS